MEENINSSKASGLIHSSSSALAGFFFVGKDGTLRLLRIEQDNNQEQISITPDQSRFRTSVMIVSWRRQWLEGTQELFLIWTDHRNLEYLRST